MTSPAPLPPHRRIVTAHERLPAELAGRRDPASGEAYEPAVKILFDDDQADKNTNIWWGSTPAVHDPANVDLAQTPPVSLVNRGGSNFKTSTLAPGQVTCMHRTSSLDYNIITHGCATLLTPLNPSTPSQWPPSSFKESRTDVLETKVHAGEVVVQRGTLHAWRNDTSEFVRWTCVLTDAEPVDDLPEVWVLEGDEIGGPGIVRPGKNL